VDILDFMLQIIRDLTGLIIILGFLLFVVSFVKISGKIEILDPADRNKARAIGAILLLVGFTGYVYPKTVNVSGEIKYWDGKPADDVRVQIDNASTTTNENGLYQISNVPRSAKSITFVFKNYAISKELNIPFYSLISKDMPWAGEIINFTIDGAVTDELGNPLNNVIVKVGDISCPVQLGRYILSQVPIPPNQNRFVSVIDASGTKYLGGAQISYFSKDETEKKYKKYDFAIPLYETMNVFGTVRRYCGQKDSHPEPVMGATVEMGGRSNLTDEKGNYLITKVPIRTASYNITLISGEKIAGNIMPPLAESEKNAARMLWLLDKN
jgi:hypothetical protein